MIKTLAALFAALTLTGCVSHRYSDLDDKGNYRQQEQIGSITADPCFGEIWPYHFKCTYTGKRLVEHEKVVKAALRKKGKL